MLVAGILFAGCAKDVEPPKPPVVKVQQVKLSNAAQEENYSGVVRGRYETNLSFQVSGKIISRDVQTGSAVRAGEILMTLDPQDIVEQSHSASAQVASAKAQLQLAKSNLDRYTELNTKLNTTPPKPLTTPRQLKLNKVKTRSNIRRSLQMPTVSFQMSMRKSGKSLRQDKLF